MFELSGPGVLWCELCLFFSGTAGFVAEFGSRFVHVFSPIIIHFQPDSCSGLCCIIVRFCSAMNQTRNDGLHKLNKNSDHHRFRFDKMF